MQWPDVAAEVRLPGSCRCVLQLLLAQGLVQQHACQLLGRAAAVACMLGTLPAPHIMPHVPCLEAFWPCCCQLESQHSGMSWRQPDCQAGLCSVCCKSICRNVNTAMNGSACRLRGELEAQQLSCCCKQIGESWRWPQLFSCMLQVGVQRD